MPSGARTRTFLWTTASRPGLRHAWRRRRAVPWPSPPSPRPRARAGSAPRRALPPRPDRPASDCPTDSSSSVARPASRIAPLPVRLVPLLDHRQAERVAVEAHRLVVVLDRQASRSSRTGLSVISVPPCVAGAEKMTTHDDRRTRRNRWRRSSACSTTTRSTGYPPTYARDGIPTIERYHDGQTTPTPEAIDFTPGELLGSVSGELGLRRFLEERGHRLVVTSDKDGPDSAFERELPDAEIVISQPFWPAYLTAERIAKAPNLKLALTAGIGSDHVDLQAAMDRGDHGDRGDLLQQHQRRRARGDADPLARPELPPGAPGRPRRRLEHRRLRLALVRPRGHAGRHGRCRPDRLGRAAAAEAVRGRAPLHRPPPPPARGRGGARRHLPPDGRVARRGLRRRDDQRAAAPGDRAPVRRRADRADEARRLPRQHRARQDLRPRRRRRARARAGSWPATRATSGSRSRRRRTIRGARCRTTA